MNYDKIGNFIALLRKEKNLTQKELAFKLNITDKAVSKWERGLGCPDVSLLEELSKILEVSILELLKGRHISSSELSNDDINDYVLETVKYSNVSVKEKIKKLFLNTLTVIIIGISSFLILINILHIIQLNEKVHYDFSSSVQVKLIKDNIVLMKNNIQKLKTSKTIYNDEDKKEIIKYLDEGYNKYSEFEKELDKNKKSFSSMDRYVLGNKISLNGTALRIYDIAGKYNAEAKKYKDFILTIYSSKVMLRQKNYGDLSENYKYKFNFDSTYNPFSNPISIMLYDATSDIAMFNFSLDFVLEVGVINE